MGREPHYCIGAIVEGGEMDVKIGVVTVTSKDSKETMKKPTDDAD